MIINTARFVKSHPSVENCPTDLRHEYAFIGRSNVGKSSLINMLTGKPGLAMTSSTPGKTMLINYFLVNDSWYIVDLPGYGYARRSKAAREKLEKMIKDYILYREQMTNLFVLIDSRLEPQKIDLEFMEWLGENGVPFSIVFTKTDKQSASATERNIAAYCTKLLEQWEELPPVFISSSVKGNGKNEILDYIEQLNKLPLETNETEIMKDNENKQTTPSIKDIDNKLEYAKEDLPGASIDVADNEKDTENLVKERTKTLDNEPYGQL